MNAYREEAETPEPDGVPIRTYPVGEDKCPFCGEVRWSCSKWFSKRIVSRFDRKTGMCRERCRTCKAEWLVEPRGPTRR